MLLTRFICHNKWIDGQMRNYLKIGLLKQCVIYIFCIDNEHDEGEIKVESFF